MLVDVREQSDIRRCAFDLKNVRMIPVYQFPKRMQELPKDCPLIIADNGNEKSKRGAATLLGNGFTEVYSLEGGISAWEKEGLPVIRNEDYLNAFPRCNCG